MRLVQLIPFTIALCAANLTTRAVLADANFPSASVTRHGPELVRADGVSWTPYASSPFIVLN